MKLEEMQKIWFEMSEELEQQKKLSNQLIMEMTQERFKNKIGIIAKYENIGAIICVIAAMMLLSKFEELDTWYLFASGLFTVSYLILLPVLVLQSIQAMQRINLTHNTYKETLISYAKKKKQFLLIQRVGIYLNFILLGVSLPVIIKVFKGKDIFVTNSEILYWYIPIMVTFLVIFSIWGYKKYKKITISGSQMLEEINEVA